MRISMISTHYAEYSARLALALARDHVVQLHLSAPNAGRELDEAMLATLSQALELHLHPHTDRKLFWLHGWRMAAKVRRFKPDILHAQEVGEWTLWWARRLIGKKPFVYTVHDPLPHLGDDNTRASRTLWPRRRLRQGADAIIVHGHNIVGDMLIAEPSSAGKVHVVMHGILGSSTVSIQPGERKRLLFFGRIETYKGLGILLEAMQILGDRGITPPLLIAGRGPDLDSHRQQIAALPNVTLDERFIPSDEVADMLAQSRAVVLPYLEATQSGVVAHAFGAGVPVIASRVGALADVLTDGNNALLVPPGAPLALADAIARFISQDGLGAALTEGALHTANTLMSWPAIGEVTVAVHRIAQSRSAPVATTK